ncbi:MAG: LLM class flavin-dependent oxidoreductase [Actinomycetota bacterium]
MQASLGYVVPSSSGTDVPSMHTIDDIARTAELGNLNHLWVSDHLLWWHPMHEALTLLATLAARTTTTRIGTAVLQLAMREPVATAKALATIERLSGGRLTVGIGVGGEFPAEWDATASDRRTRGRRTDQMIDSFKDMWGPGQEGVDLYPKPSMQPPIWIGGRSDASLKRAAKRADGWMGLFLTPERFASMLAKCRAYAEEGGRDPAALLPSLYVWTCIADSNEEARRIAQNILGGFYNLPFDKLSRYAILGDVEHCRERFAEFEDAGARHFAVSPIWPESTKEPLERLLSIGRS